MNNLLKFLGAFILIIALVCMSVILGTFFGALTGWFVGLFYGETIIAFFAILGVKGLSMYQIGASLGFVGGFFRASVAEKEAT